MAKSNIFRTLNANEIECRIAMIKVNGLSLLLYKDARCDMNILDETALRGHVLTLGLEGNFTRHHLSGLTIQSVK